MKFQLIDIILSLGPNFGFNFEYKQLPITKTVANIESTIFKNPAETQIRAEVTNIITNFLNGYKVTNLIKCYSSFSTKPKNS